MSTRYNQKFGELEARGEGAFTGFLVLGDPDRETSLRLMTTLVESGCDMLELGIPFSDPLADGPTIQAAMDRALKAGVTPKSSLDLVREFRRGDQETPIGLLVYANLVYARGIDNFYRQCRESEIDSVLVADAPLTECAPFCDAALRHEIDPVLLCPPNIDEVRIAELARLGRGYTYLLSRAGVTGTAVSPGRPVRETLRLLKKYNAAPPLVGFGISQSEHVRGAMDAGARGVICGSAIIERIANNRFDDLADFVREMKAATRV